MTFLQTVLQFGLVNAVWLLILGGMLCFVSRICLLGG